MKSSRAMHAHATACDSTLNPASSDPLLRSQWAVVVNAVASVRQVAILNSLLPGASVGEYGNESPTSECNVFDVFGACCPPLQAGRRCVTPKPLPTPRCVPSMSDSDAAGCGCGIQLNFSLRKLGACMAFIRRLRLERAEPDLNTSEL